MTSVHLFFNFIFYFLLLEIETKASCIIGKHLTVELQPQPGSWFFKKRIPWGLILLTLGYEIFFEPKSFYTVVCLVDLLQNRDLGPIAVPSSGFVSFLLRLSPSAGA